MIDSLRHLQLLDSFKERLDNFIRAHVEKLSFDKAQYDIEVSKDEPGGHTKYTINLQITDYGQQVVQLTPRHDGFSINVHVVEKGKKTIPQFLISMFHEDLLGEYLDNSVPEVPEGNDHSHTTK